MGHPFVMSLRHPRLLPGKPIVVSKCHVDHKKGGLEVVVLVMIRERQKRVTSTEGFPTVLFVLLVLSDTTPLECDVSEGIRAEVRHIPQSWSDDRARPREIETIDEDAVGAFERDVLDPTMPDDFRYEIHGRRDDVGIGRHHEHAGDTPGIEPVPLRFRFLDEKRSDCPRKQDQVWRHTGGRGGIGF